MDECDSIYYNGSYRMILSEGLPMKMRLALMIILTALLLGGCSYWVVEDAPVQVGSSVVLER